MIIMIIFFIALLAILKKVAWGPLMNVMEERENFVANEIDLAEKNRKEAEEANAKANAQLNETKEEAQKMIADAKAAGEKQQADIIESARQEATRIKTTATEDIQNEKEKAMQELQDQVASLSVLVASKVIEAKRYADALFQLAEENNLTSEFVSELDVVETVFEQNESLAPLLASPDVKTTDKLALIDTAFNSIHVFIKNEFKMMVERNRSNVILQMIQEFKNLYNEKNSIAHAVVTSVRSLSADELSNVEETFKKLLNKSALIIENKVDASLLGGIRIRVGNTIYDGTLSNKLRRIEQNLLTANK